MPRVIRAYVRWVEAASDAMGWCALWLIYAMVGVLLYDVLMDRLFALTQIWTVETAQFLLAGFYFLAGPKTLKDEDHVRLDVLYERLSPRRRALTDAVTIWIVVFFLGIMLWGGVSSLIYSIETSQRLPSLWAPSVVPIKACMVVCLALMLLQCLATFFRDVARARGRDLDGTPLAAGEAA